MLRNQHKALYKIALIILMINLVLTHDHSGDHQHHHHHDHHNDHNDHDHHQHHHHEHEHDNHDHHNHHEHHEESPEHTHDHDHNHHSHDDHDHSHQQHSNIQSKEPQLLMISDKPRLLQTLKLTPITVFYYGNTTTQQYQEFTTVIPAYNDEYFSQIPTPIQFVFISSEKFKLSRPNPSLSIYRNINNGEWLMYRGIFEKTQILNWITKNIVDPLKQLSGQEVDGFFVDGKKGFIVLDFGQFYLLNTKIMISQFCQKFELYCGKVSHTNKALNMMIQLMRAQKQPGIPKLGFWDPKRQQLEIYTKDVGLITETELMQLYSGHQSMIPYEAELDVAKVIHPETEFIEVEENAQQLEL